MGVDKGGGTDTRPDNADPSPATPPDDPGSPRRPSRLESRAASGQEGNGSPPAEGTGSGAQTEGQRDGRPGSPQAAGAGKAEAAGKAENGQGRQHDQEPRSRDAGAGSGGAASGGRDRPQGPPSERDTDARAEPADRSPSPGRQYKLPDDNPGQPTQPSRLESHARARELQQQRAAQNAEGTGGGSGGPPGEARDGRSAPPQEGSRADTAQPPGRADTGGTGRDAPAEGHGERGAAGGEGVYQDARPPETPPADTAAASGGASGGEASGERDRPAAQPSGEQAGGPAPETGRPQGPEHPPLPHQDNASAPSDSGTPPGTEQKPQGAGELGTDEQGADERGTDRQGADGQGDGPPRPEPSAETGDRTTGPAPTPPDSTHGTPEPADRAAEPMRETGTNPQALDGPADNDRTPPPEAPEPAEAAGTGADQPAQRPQDRPGTEQPGEATAGIPDGGTTDDPPAAPEQGEPTQPGTEIRSAAAGSTVPDSETDDQRTTDDAPPPPEHTDRDAEAPEPRGEPGGDHGKKGQENGSEQDPDETNRTNPEVPEPADGSTPPDRDAPQSPEDKEPGGELAPQGEAPVETEPRRFEGRVRIAVDSEGRPLLPNREPVETEVGTRGRGEFGSPETDPADRDPSKTDPERSSRRDELRRGVFERPSDVKKSVDTLSEPIKHGFERVPPTGQHEGFNRNTDQFRAPDHPLQAGSVVLTTASAVIVLMEAGRRGAGAVRQLIRKNHGDHR